MIKKSKRTPKILDVFISAARNKEYFFGFKDPDAEDKWDDKMKFEILSVKEQFGYFKVKLLDQEPEFFQVLLKTKKSIQFFMPESHMSFFTTIMDIEDSGEEAMITIPDEVSFYNRRKIDRVRMEDDPLKISFIHASKTYTAKLYDLGHTGCSIVFPKNQLLTFKKEDLIKKVWIHEFGLDFIVEGRIVQVRKLRPNELEQYLYGGKRVAVEFKKVEKSQEKILNDYIEQNSLMNIRIDI